MLRHRLLALLPLIIALAGGAAFAQSAKAQSAGKVERIAALNEARPSGLAPAGRSAATCALGTASTDLDVGGVRARLYNNGGLFWRGGDPVYEVPKGSGIQAIFAAGLWIGAEVPDELRFAGADYSDWEYWPGPLDANGEAPTDCTPFDRFWTVAVQPDGSLAGDVANWPVELGAAFDDANGDGEYDPADGDRPTVYGHQTTFWVMNDKGNAHNWSNAQPLGVEVRVTAFAVDSSDPAFGFATFYRYEIENKSADVLENLRVGFWTDADLGNFGDDYVGSDPERGLSFIYNGDNSDEDGYETPPPALGVDVLSGAEGMMYYGNDGSVTGVPRGGGDAYRYLNLRWRDDTPVTEGGTGYNPGTEAPSTTWFFSGAPETAALWSELLPTGGGTANRSGDRRFISVAAPTTLAPGETTTVDAAILFAVGSTFLSSVSALRDASDVVQQAYDAGALFGSFGPRTGPPIFSPGVPTQIPGRPRLLFPPSEFNFNDLAFQPDSDGQVLGRFEWTPLEGSQYYQVEFSNDPTFGSGVTARTVAGANEVLASVSDGAASLRYWRVQGISVDGASAFSTPDSFYAYNAAAQGFAGGGFGIIEVTAPGASPCQDPSTPGCARYGGAQVWHTPNPTNDYYLTAAGPQGTINRIVRFVSAALPFDYEIRFSGRCQSGGCYAIDSFGDGCRGQCRSFDDPRVVRVPFELWQTGINTPDDPSDDVRMIPFIDVLSDLPGSEWRYGVEPNTWRGGGIDGGADPDALVSDVIYGLMPDRPDGYTRFAAVAAETGPGRIYPSGFDGDDQVDLSPATGQPCPNQAFYTDFCHRNDAFEPGNSAFGSDFVAPLARIQLADQAGDGTPPPPGTVIRFAMQERQAVAAEPGPTMSSELTLSVYPNPSRGAATVAYEVAEAGWVRVSVVDVLGRERAVVVEGEQGAGVQRVGLEGLSLGSGLYVVRVETGGRSATRKVLVVR